MLNLKKLEAELDNVLASETQETLLEWLMAKRADKLKTLLGDGDIEPFEVDSVVARYATTVEFINCEVSKSTNHDSDSTQKVLNDFSFAA